jgi:putative tryptophan/tyrosine transport system permease protein
MLIFKLSSIASEGIIFGLLAIGIYVAFQWLRFPDLTPDGSFTVGAAIYVKAVGSGFSPALAIIFSIAAGAMGGCCTAIITQFIKVPSVVAGLLVSSAFYSINWLILGKPNQFLEPSMTLVGDVSGLMGTWGLLLWLTLFCLIVILGLDLFSKSIWGIRTRAIGQNPILAKDLGLSETLYVCLGLAIANGLVGLAGALFAQRSFSADIGMGIGVTIVGLTGVILGLLIVGNRRKESLILFSILIGSIFYKAAIFTALEIGIPAEAFRLVSASILLLIFSTIKTSDIAFLKELKWN